MRLFANERFIKPDGKHVAAGAEFDVDDAVGVDLLNMHPNMVRRAPLPDPVAPSPEPQKQAKRAAS